jgi:hypothetical protein
MSDKQTVKIVPDQRQLRGLYAAFRNMDEASKNALKTEVTGISAWSADQLRTSYVYNPFPKQAEIVISTVRPNKDRIPNVTIGGSKGRFSGGAVSGQVLFGSEFGGPSYFPNGGRRFPFRSEPKGRGNVGYGIFKKLSEIQPQLTARWKSAVETHVIKKWSDNG